MRGEKINLRSSAENDGNIRAQLFPGAKFQIKQNLENWVRVGLTINGQTFDNSNKGYIHKSQVECTDQKQFNALDYQGPICTTKDNQEVLVRNFHSPDAEILYRLNKKRRVKAIAKIHRYYSVIDLDGNSFGITNYRPSYIFESS